MNEFEELIRRLVTWAIQRLRVVFLVLLALTLVFTSIKTIGPEEEGVVLYLGKFDRKLDPGLNIIMPIWLETVYKIHVQRSLKHEFGFRTGTAGVRSEYASTDYRSESSMLTGDLNLADVEWVVQYRIVDSYRYLFRVRDAEKTLRDMSEAAMRTI